MLLAIVRYHPLCYIIVYWQCAEGHFKNIKEIDTLLLEVKRFCANYRLRCWLAIGTWASHFKSLGLIFLICKIRKWTTVDFCIDSPQFVHAFLYPHLCIDPLHTDAGTATVTCFRRWENMKYDKTQVWKLLARWVLHSLDASGLPAKTTIWIISG